MENSKIIELLERIATSLEKIADSIDSNDSKKRDKAKSSFKNLDVISLQDIKDKSSKSSTSVERSQSIELFLTSKGISIKALRKEDESDEVLDNIALFIGDRFTLVKKLYRKIKKNLNSRKSFKLDLKSANQDEISSITQLCTKLHQIAFLDEYRYYKSPQYYLFAKVNPIPKSLNFFSGGWLERYIKRAVEKSIQAVSDRVKLKYSYMKNPQIILPNGNDFELDLIYQIEGEIFWFEAKTGDYQRHIQKYSNMANILKLDHRHSFMILAEGATEDKVKVLRRIFNMDVVGVENFYQRFSIEVNRIADNVIADRKRVENSN
jgi:hypothetical protein